MTTGTSRHNGFTARLLSMFVVTILLFSIPAISVADASIDLSIDLSILEVPPQPQPVSEVLRQLLSDTLADVLIGDDGASELLASDPGEVAEAIRTGINIVIEPKGYAVTDLRLDLEASPIKAELTLKPVGWTESDSHAVGGVVLTFEPGNLDAFWISRISERLNSDPGYIEFFGGYLIGLPTQAVDSNWALQIVRPYIESENSANSLLPSYSVDYDIVIDQMATVTLTFHPKGDLVERIRPRMYSFTLLNVVMDRFRERLLAAADFIEGIPRDEIELAKDEIEARLSEAIENDSLAEDLDAYASIQIELLDYEPVVVVDVRIESRRYDTSVETFIDFGNEALDSSEIQCRLGFLVTRGVEIFTNLNYFTNDSALDTDVGLGLRPYKGSFVGIGYDLDREFVKYYAEQDLYPGLSLRAEIFEEDTLNEFGMVYQFQQYIAAGAFTNGDNEFWARAIFSL